MTEREKVIYDIERCICHVPDACKDCSKYGGDNAIRCMEELLTDALSLLKAQKDMVRVVRCSDCRYWEPENAEEGDSYGRCRNNYAPCQNQQTDMTWFCAEGEREDG